LIPPSSLPDAFPNGWDHDRKDHLALGFAILLISIVGSILLLGAFAFAAVWFGHLLSSEFVRSVLGNLDIFRDHTEAAVVAIAIGAIVVLAALQHDLGVTYLSVLLIAFLGVVVWLWHRR
jgi:nicotinamide riboside transporter PnuC